MDNLTPNRRKKPQIDDFSPEMWITIRVLFESGKFRNITTMIKDQSPLFADFPPRHLIQKVADEQGWDKHALDEITTEIVRRNAGEVLAELGMDQVKRYSYLANTIRAADGVLGIVERLQNKISDLQDGEEINDALLNKIKTISETVFKGMAVSVKAQDIAIKLTGEYAPEKVKGISTNSYKRADGSETSVEDMTEEEILQEINRMKRARIKDPMDNDNDNDDETTDGGNNVN